MTVPVAPRYQNFTGSGTTGPFSFTFPILLSSTGVPQITVTRISAAGVQTVLAYPSDYTFVPLQLGLGGGTITTAVAVAGDGSRLFAEATTPLDQVVKYSNQGDFFPETHEKSFDKLHYIAQEQARFFALSIKLPTTDVSGADTSLPSAAVRANQAFIFDASGNPTVGSFPNTVVSLVMQPVISALTLADARTAMGAVSFNGVEVLTNKTVYDETFYIKDNSDVTKVAKFQLSGLTTGTERVYSAPNKSGTMALTDDLPNRNALINGAFDVWQRGTSFTPSAGAVSYVADRWFAFRTGSANYTVSRYGSSSGTVDYGLKVQRTAASTDVQGPLVSQIMESVDAIKYAGKTVTLSYDAVAGANFSAASSTLLVSCQTGTGTDQGSTSLVSGTWTGVANTLNASQAITTSRTRYSHTFTIPAGTKEIAVRFAFTPVGTAGADDSFGIESVQLELGSVATEYEKVRINETVAACRRWLRAYGDVTGPYAHGSCINTNTAGYFLDFGTEMRAAPTMVAPITVGNFSIRSFGGADLAVFTSITLDSASKYGAFLQVGVAATPLTANVGVVFKANTLLAGNLKFTAEL